MKRCLYTPSPNTVLLILWAGSTITSSTLTSGSLQSVVYKRIFDQENLNFIGYIGEIEISGDILLKYSSAPTSPLH